MIKIKSLMAQPLFSSSLPLLGGGSFHLLKTLFSGILLSKDPFSSGSLQSESMKRHWLEVLQDNGTNPELDFVTLLDQISFGVYSNLFTFLLVMLLLDLFIRIAKNGIHGFWKEVTRFGSRLPSLNNSSAKEEWKLFNLISENQIKRTFSFVVIFMILQIVGLCLNLAQSELLTSMHRPALTSSQGGETFSPMNLMNYDGTFENVRILKEEEVTDTTIDQPSIIMTSDKISLSMGNILSSLSINVNAMVLSKDKKIAFVTIDFYGTLQILDISDLQSPYILSTLNLAFSTYNYRIKSLVLSSDEKTLYLSNSKEFEIVDVTDPSSPKLVSLTKSEIFGVSITEPVFAYFKTSLAVSESTKTLYIGGIGLQIYDISDPKKPLLLKAFKNEWNDQGYFRNEVCLSRDGKILFIANGALDVYNISNPKEIKKMHSFTTESSPRSIMLSEDFQTAFLLGNNIRGETVYEEMDISNYKIQNTVYLEYGTAFSPRFLAISPSKSKIFIYAQKDYQKIDLLIFDRLKQTTLQNERSLIEETMTMDFALDGKTLITGSNGQFMAIELFLEYPNSQIFSTSQNNSINSIPLSTYCKKMEMSEDGQHLFILRAENNDEYNRNDIFEILDLKGSVLSSYNCHQPLKQMYFTKDKKTVYLVSAKSIFALDIKDRSSINLEKIYQVPTTEKFQFESFIASSDETIGFTVIRKGSFGHVNLFDLSKPSGTIESFVKLNLQSEYSYNGLILTDDEKTLIVINQEITIYDISNLSSPIHISTMPIGVNEPEQYVKQHILSSEKLYLETFDQSGFTKLRIYDLSILSSPQILSEKFFSKDEVKNIQPGLQLSLDLKNGFVFQENYLIKVDLTNLKKPEISGIISLTWNKSEKVNAFLLSPDNQTIYTSIGSEIRSVNMNIQYTLFLKHEKFLLGDKSSDTLSMLNLTAGSYSLVDTESYKIIKMSLMEIKVVPNKPDLEMTTSLLPSWMTFDRENNILTVEPKKQKDIGTYTLHSSFSLKISREIFNDIGTAEEPVSSEDLVAWLISLDYVDPQLYLTANFRSYDTFYLPSNFFGHRREIYNLLKKYHVETCTLFEVVSSLKVEETKISTLSTNNIKVEIKLEPGHGVDAKFVHRPYGSLLPVVKDNKTKISLEGSLKEINTAINLINVNFENETFCDANIFINDGLNPSVSVVLHNISRYFKANNPPYLNKNSEKTVQEQIDSANLQTGVYFTLTLSEDSFEDDFAESLNYDLKTTQNNTAFPHWMTFNGLTLKGTPPEEIFGRDLEMILIVKNEFKQYEVPFKLHIKISTVFWLKLVMRYSPYILTLIGLYVSANKIFNILRKDFYKHSKEFYVGVGEKISGSVIFPISFIKEEQKQSQLILKYMRHVDVADFMDSSHAEKIILAIEEAIQKMPIKSRKQITLYPNPIIDQIIINKCIWMQLDSREEIRTRELFEDLKPYCLEVIERDGSGFMMNQNQFNKLIRRVKMPPTERNDTLEESLISHQFDYPGVNLNLLKDAILASAFEHHSIDISPIDVDIGVKQQVPSNALFRILKFDLRDIFLDYKNKINYGLSYQIIGDKLCFYGIAQDNLKDKTLVIQIKNIQHKIIKEIWIRGVSKEFQKDELFMIRDESEARGQGYEIY